MSRSFVVTSWGRTANFWLAKVLNAHPDVLCAYGPDLAPAKIQGEATDAERNRRYHRDGDKVAAMSADQYLDILQAAGEYKVYGTVHGLTPGQALAPSRREFAVANLVRHPVHRVASNAAWWQWEIAVNEVARADYEARFAAAADETALLEERFEVDFTEPANWLFVNAARSLVWDRHDFDLAIDQVPMERMTSDADYCRALVERLTGGAIDPAPVMDAFEAEAALNKSGRAGRDAARVYADWADWQRLLFDGVITTLDLADDYRALGYVLP